MKRALSNPSIRRLAQALQDSGVKNWASKEARSDIYRLMDLAGNLEDDFLEPLFTYLEMGNAPEVNQILESFYERLLEVSELSNHLAETMPDSY